MSEVEGYTPADEWKRYVRPCDANGVEHDCMYDFIEGWNVELFAEWLASERARIWDERGRAMPQYLGPYNGHYGDCMGWEDCHCAIYPNPYRKGGDA